MRLDEDFPYYEINFDAENYEKRKYNEIVQTAINEWEKMRNKKEKCEIYDEKYFDWNFNFEIIT